MASGKDGSARPTLRRQLLLCAAMSSAALILIVFALQQPVGAVLRQGLPLWQQLGLGLATGLATGIGALLTYRLQQALPAAREASANYGRLDLSGARPVYIALAAGVGEELLFRGALQPLLGPWLSSLLFVLAHAQAYRFRAWSKTTLVQASGLLCTSLMLAAVYHYVGLVAAIVIHVLVDVIGLYTVRASGSQAARIS